MNIEELKKIKKESERVTALYDVFNEESRLSSKAGQVEFLTTIRQIEKHLKSGMKILDVGAGTGEYSLYFAENGYDVTAVELVEKHVNQIKSKVNKEMNIEVYQGNALDLSMAKDNSFDIVLCFGPLYHLGKEEDKIKCIDEIKRVCKRCGKMFFAFISNDMVIATELLYNSKFLIEDDYNHETFKINDFPFVFHTVDACRELLNKSHIKIISEVATDGFSELLADVINNMDDKSYEQWLKYHFYICEKPELLGASNHLLFAAELE